ncbi:MAG: LamG domain-containing protein [Opitutaceae bacterium]|jgi:hypothetical protein|nr:LamG domain-containing protein [Opitutaceae bacterium]
MNKQQKTNRHHILTTIVFTRRQPVSQTLLGISGLALAFAGSVAAAVPAPVLEFNFNSTAASSTATSTGTDTATGTFHDSAGGVVSKPTNSAGLTGATNGTDDGAFNNYVTGGALGGAGDVFKVGNGADTLFSSTSFTLSGWFHTTGAPGYQKDAYLIQTDAFSVYFSGTVASPSANMGFTVRIGTTSLTVKGTSTDPTNILNKANQWTFFAVSYDSTLSSGNVKLYAGTDTADVKLIWASTTQAVGLGGITATQLAVGNGLTEQKAFRGYIDDIRLWDSVLVLDQLKDVRTADLANSAIPAPVPEPSAWAFLAGATILALAILRHRR